MEPQITSNTFLVPCRGTSSTPNESLTTIFFVSGNPGLISYYYPFLSLLSKYLAESKAKGESKSPQQHPAPSLQIYGCSLGGFEVHTEDDDASDKRFSSTSNCDNQNSNSDQKRKYFDLEDQIQFVQGKLASIPSTAAQTQKRNVILVGHSVGAYIAMEILRRHREQESGLELKSELESAHGLDRNVDFDITGGVMLFPTVVDIADSPSGQRLTTLLSFIPHLALVVDFLTRLLTFLLPDTALRSLIRFAMNGPPEHALETTLTFLKSPGCVRQALHMATDEMRVITTDKWTDDVWGAATAHEPIAKLFFYFGRNDHWVAEKTRDEIIALRGRGEGRGPTMFVCEDGLPHAFCLRDSDIMARKVAGMIWEIVAPAR